MANITLNVEEEVIKKVRKIAIDRNTTLTAIVREYLHSVAARDATERERVINKLKRDFDRLSRDMGKRTWTRNDLYD